MPFNKGIVVDQPGKASIHDLPYPDLPSDDSIIVRTRAVAINPVDWQEMDGDDENLTGSVMGFDYAGTVEDVGPAVTQSFKKGDHIAGIVHGR
jgi:NADPH:quinone reductase-like Zn-dependent oxidoreductase